MKRDRADRPQSAGEERANALSHGFGFLLSMASLPILVKHVARQCSALEVAAASVFSGTMILLYLVSALYHAVSVHHIKRWLNRLDHAAIYLFIAGSYTPFALGLQQGSRAWALFCTVWALAACGITVKLLNCLQHPGLSIALYLAMGWLAVVAAAPTLARMPGQGLTWLMAGALCYSVGAMVFLLDHRVRYAHFVWHLLVMGGSGCHYLAVRWCTH